MGIKRPFEGHLDGPGCTNTNEDLTLDEYSSSDDSVDVDVGATQPPQASISDQKYGIGAELMAKMGYESGSGLGQDKRGILDPIELEKRQKRAGLGMETREPPETLPLKAQPSIEQRTKIQGNSKMVKLKAARYELDAVRRLQESLNLALQVISDGGYDLDVLKLYEHFGDQPIWFSERLYEVVAAILNSRIPSTDAFEWLTENPDVLLSANQLLPDDEWGNLLAEKWLSKSPVDVSRLLKQWVVGRHKGFGAAANRLSVLFGDRDIVQLSVSQGREFLVELLDALPDSSYLVSELKRSLPNYPLKNQAEVLAAVPFETAFIARLILKIPDLPSQNKVLTEFSKVLSKEILSEILKKTRIREQWLDDLHASLKSSNLDSLAAVKVSWDQWRPFFLLFINEVVEPWLKAGLDAINEALDGTQQHLGQRLDTAPRDVALQRRVTSSLKDVVDHICYMNDFKLVTTAMGYILRGPRRGVEFMIENDVILIRRSRSLIPVSLDVLQSYLLK